LENERPKQQNIQQQAKRLEQPRLRLQQEQQQLRIEVDGLDATPKTQNLLNFSSAPC
jgi:hypothetical protein